MMDPENGGVEAKPQKPEEFCVSITANVASNFARIASTKDVARSVVCLPVCL